MPAESLNRVLNFEPQLTGAAKNILTDGGFDQVWRPGDPGIRPAAFTAVDVEIGDATGRLGMRPEGTQEYAQFTATLMIAVAVERAENLAYDDNDGSALDLNCAKIRALFLNHPNPFPRYTEFIHVHAIKPMATQYDSSTDEAIDMRVLRWELQFIVADSAWPAV
jgi:hypothetical protein